MRFYSEKTKKFYDTDAECLKAEKDYDVKLEKAEAEKKAKAEERTARAKEVEEAYKQMVDARKKYNDLLAKFCEDYKTFHMSLTYKDLNPIDAFTRFFSF